jgi:hypothetical protein
VRIPSAVILCFSVMLFAHVEYSEPPAQPRIFFGAPTTDDKGKNLILLRSFKPGLNVTLLSTTEICKAKTGSALKYQTPSGDGKATKLVEIEKSPKDPIIAVVGAEAESVELRLPEQDPVPLPKALERKAGRIVGWPPEKTIEGEACPLSSSRPIRITVGHVTLLNFLLKDTDGSGGPAILLINNRLFRLEVEGDNLNRPVFFTVNDKLHLAYVAFGCANGYNAWKVYDLSDKSPKMVYCNGDFDT